MTEISLFGNLIRGDFFLVLSVIVAIAFVWLVAITSKKNKSKDSTESELLQLLSKPEILQALESGNDGLSRLINHLEAKENESSTQNESSLLSTTSQKIINDIEWDVAGLIGVGVTIVLLFMVVSGTIDQIPEQIFTGWLLILGYYFGKGSRQ